MANANLLKHRDAAERIQQKYVEQINALRQNKDLSEEGRSRRLAEVYAKTQRELNRLANAQRDEAASRRTALESQLYSNAPRAGQDPASHAISVRDAADRAAMLETPEQAARLMRDAEANGDSVLARAILRRVVERPSMGRGVDDAWTEVARDYVDRHGEVLRIVEELAEIEHLGKREVFSPFTAQPPQGVASKFINEANGAAMAEAGA